MFLKHEMSTWLAISHLLIVSTEDRNTDKYLHINVHTRIIHIHQKVATLQPSVDEQTEYILDLMKE